MRVESSNCIYMYIQVSITSILRETLLHVHVHVNNCIPLHVPYEQVCVSRYCIQCTCTFTICPYPLPPILNHLLLVVFEEPEDPSTRSFFSEIIASISDVKFSHSGRYILSRDYLTVKVLYTHVTMMYSTCMCSCALGHTRFGRWKLIQSHVSAWGA